MTDDAERVAAAERVLRDHGVAPVRVTTAGHEQEVAAIAAPPESLERVAEIASELKALGFKYITLDLTRPQ